MKMKKKLKAFVYPYAVCLTLIPFMERSLEHHKAIFFSALVAFIIMLILTWTSLEKRMNFWRSKSSLRGAISIFIFMYTFALTFNPYVNPGISHYKSILFACILGSPAFLIYLAKFKLNSNH